MNLPVNDKPECRVLQVFSCLGVGGAETWLMALLRYFDEAKDELPYRIRFDICLTGGVKGVFDAEAASLGAKLFYPHYCRRNLPAFIHEFRSILANGRYHAIHDHQDYTAGLHFLFGIGHLPPVRIAHVHNPLIHIESYSTSRIRRYTVNAGKHLLAGLATHIIGTSRQILLEYGFDEDRFSKVRRSAVHCGFNVSQFLRNHSGDHLGLCNEFGFEPRAKIILFVGRLMADSNGKDNQKNPEFAIEVAKKCIDIDPGVRMIMAGSGEEMRKKLQDDLRGLGLHDKIVLIGSRTDVPRLMSGSDLLLFPSVAEGLGMVAVEAQAAGLRVLTSGAVPRECEAISGMVEFKSLDAGSLAWAEEALRLISLPRTDSTVCNLAVKLSPFSIEESAKNLLNIFLQGEDSGKKIF